MSSRVALGRMIDGLHIHHMVFGRTILAGVFGEPLGDPSYWVMGTSRGPC